MDFGERRNVGEAPFLIARSGHRQRIGALERLRAALIEP
jgi:hypothetical protein